jgi:hypothetical protein
VSEQQKPAAIVPPPYPKTTPFECATGNPICGRPARLYAVGWRCDIHNPAAWAAHLAAQADQT